MKPKNGKFPKDPNRPKKGRSGYFIFLSDKREETKKNFPKLGNKELIAKLGEIWSNLPEKAKKPFMTKAEKEKKGWLVEITEYEKTDNYKKFIKKKRIYDKCRKFRRKSKDAVQKKSKEQKTSAKTSLKKNANELNTSPPKKATEKRKNLKSKQGLSKQKKTMKMVSPKALKKRSEGSSVNTLVKTYKSKATKDRSSPKLKGVEKKSKKKSRGTRGKNLPKKVVLIYFLNYNETNQVI